MNIFRRSISVSFALSLALAALAMFAVAAANAAGNATDRLKYYDGATATASFDGHVQLYAAPVKGVYGTPQRYRAQLLIARPDRFRLVLRPGANNEYRAVGSAGVVQWRDLATGLTGQGKATDYIDPAALDVLGTVGELNRLAPAKELPALQQGSVRGATLSPRSYGNNVLRAIAWFRNDQPYLYEFEFRDGRKLFFSVSSFKHNPPTKPSDFQL
jgi:hypothetical protein